MNKLVVIGIVCIVAIGAFFALNGYIYNEKQAVFTEGEEVAREGRVLALDLEAIALDGPALITIELDNGGLSTIAVPSFGLLLCAAYSDITDVYALRIGDRVSVRGVIDAQGSIVPCESQEHYLRREDNIEFASPITMRGEIACLPKRGSGVQTLECAIGLAGEDGNNYALRNLFEHDPGYVLSTTGKKVEVSGVLRQEQMLGPDGNEYDIAGVIEIDSIKEQ